MAKEEAITKLKLIKQQPCDRHVEIYLGRTYLDRLLVKFDDKIIPNEKNSKNKIIDIVIDTIIKHLEEEE